eukprot:g5358.t1
MNKKEQLEQLEQRDDSESKEETQENGENEENQENDENDEIFNQGKPSKEEIPPRTIEEFFDTAVPESYSFHESFFQVYVPDDLCKVLLRVPRETMGLPFFFQVTLDGSKGGLPDMIDCTKKNNAVRFLPAANGTSLVLVEMQPLEDLNEDDFAHPIYDPLSGGTLFGESNEFAPLFIDQLHGDVLIDITSWIFSFASNVSDDNAQALVQLLEVCAFPENFFARLSTGDVYFTTAFCALPHTPMIPRPFDRRVGYFTTNILRGGANEVTRQYTVINKWNLERRGGRIIYCIDPAVPVAYRGVIKRAVESWNDAFTAAGWRDEQVIICVAPGDALYPRDFRRGDARYNAIYMTEPAIPVYGYGPSIVDPRTGEVLVSHVLLGFSAFSEGASLHSTDFANMATHHGDCRRPLLRADHPDILRALEMTVVHEVGHTLGLRHNFIAAEDENSSVMAYQDDVDTLTDPTVPVYGGHYLCRPGKYDVYAIKYGYTRVSKTRQRHQLSLLANGQDIDDAELCAEPRNPLFATDENIGEGDPRVITWIAGVANMGRDKLEHCALRRRELLQKVRSQEIFPETFTERLAAVQGATLRSIRASIDIIGGTKIDAQRRTARLWPVRDAKRVITAVVDFLVGPTLRVSPEEAVHMIKRSTQQGSYSMRRARPLKTASTMIKSVVDTLLRVDRLERIEAHASQQNDGQARARLTAFQLLVDLSFAPGQQAPPLLHPFRLQKKPLQDLTLEYIRAGLDPLRAEARFIVAQAINRIMHSDRALASVRAACRAYAEAVSKIIHLPSTNNNNFQAQPSLSLAHANWTLFLDELKRERKPTPSQVDLSALIFGQQGGIVLKCGDSKL